MFILAKGDLAEATCNVRNPKHLSKMMTQWSSPPSEGKVDVNSRLEGEFETPARE